MFKWELKKIIYSKIFIVSIVLIIGIRLYEVLKIWERGEEFRMSNGLFEELYLNEDEYNNVAIPYYQGLKDYDTMALINMEGLYLDNAFMDSYEIKTLADAKKYTSTTYEESMVTLVRKAARMVDEDSSPYEVRYYEKYIKVYNQQVHVEPVNNMDDYLQMVFSRTEIIFMVMLVWVIVLTSYVVKGQEHKRFRGIYMSTANGRRNGIMTKLAALCVVFTVFEFLCLIALIINAMTMYGFSFRVLTAPIQSVPDYMYCPIHTSIIGIIGINYLVRLVIYLMVMCVTAVMTYFLKAIPVIIGNMVLWVFPVFLLGRMDKSTYEMNHIYEKIGQYYPPSIFDYCNYISDFDYVKVGEFPVMRILCVMVIAVLFMVLSIVMLLLFAEKKNMEMGYGIKNRRN